jgi:four helix bundle protein
VTDFKRLRATALTRQLVVQTYQATANFPSIERYGLTSQMRRAAVSIGANIAEGAGRNTDRELAHFLRLARGSAHELEFQTLAAMDLGLLSEEAASGLQAQIDQLSRMLHRLIRYLTRAT